MQIGVIGSVELQVARVDRAPPASVELQAVDHRRDRSSAASFLPAGSQRRWPPADAPHPPPSPVPPAKPWSPLRCTFPFNPSCAATARKRRTIAAQICAGRLARKVIGVRKQVALQALCCWVQICHQSHLLCRTFQKILLRAESRLLQPGGDFEEVLAFGNHNRPGKNIPAGDARINLGSRGWVVETVLAGLAAFLASASATGRRHTAAHHTLASNWRLIARAEEPGARSTKVSLDGPKGAKISQASPAASKIRKNKNRRSDPARPERFFLLVCRRRAIPVVVNPSQLKRREIPLAGLPLFDCTGPRSPPAVQRPPGRQAALALCLPQSEKCHNKMGWPELRKW